jgi:hypothetical protein
MDFNTVEQSNTHRTLLFGDPSSGKSGAIAELAKHYAIDYIDLEGGGKVLGNPVFGLTADNKSRINYIHIPDTKDYPVAAVTLEKLTRFKDGTICTAHGTWDCPSCAPQPAKAATKALVVSGKVVREAMPATEPTSGLQHSVLDFTSDRSNRILVIDSMTQWNSSLLAAIMFKAGRGKLDDKAEFDDWGNLGKNLETVGSRIQNSKMNIIIITHVATIKQENGQEKLTGIAGTNNYARTFPRFFDHKVYCQIKNGKHVQSSSSLASPVVLTGSRSGADTEKDGGLLAIYTEYRNYKKI